jgi:hypothetical protein
MHTMITPDLARAMNAELDRLSARHRPERPVRESRSRRRIRRSSLRLHLRRPATAGS